MSDAKTISLAVPITRDWALNQLFAGIMALEGKEHITQILLYVDTDSRKIYNAIHDYWLEELKKITPNVYYHQSERPDISQVRILPRRQRVVDVHRDIKHLFKIGELEQTDYLFGLEDDTIVPDDALVKFLSVAKHHPKIGFVQGVQVGRWGYKMIGAWRVNNIAEPTEFVSLPNTVPQNKFFSLTEKIDGGGLYCYLTPLKHFLGHDWRLGVEERVDMQYGLDLTAAGYECFIDWSVVCGHNDFGMILLPDNDVVRLHYKQKKDGSWEMAVLGEKK